MIHLFTKDKSIEDILKNRYKINLFENLNSLNLCTESKGIAIIDLIYFKEDEIPEIDFPSIVITDVPVYDQAVRLLKKGVKGYGNRFMLEDNYDQAINAVKINQIWLPPGILVQMISSLTPASKEEETKKEIKELLTKREKEVAGLVTLGMSNTEISDELSISIRTVKAHLTSIFSKTGFRDRLELGLGFRDIV